MWFWLLFIEIGKNVFKLALLFLVWMLIHWVFLLIASIDVKLIIFQFTHMELTHTFPTIISL